MIKKVVLTNRAALRKKYGAEGVESIRKALTRLSVADAVRGITTVVEYLDSPSRAGIPKVGSAGSEKQNKAAIDALYAAHRQPDYLMILGSTDVVPHQRLRNPLFSDDDPDAFVPSDLPYACDAPYSDDIADFVGPTRVVGRLPDIRGGDDVQELISAIDSAARFERTPGKKTFIVSARVWKGATAANVKKAFGGTRSVQLCPPHLPPWKTTELKAPLHFINCHGVDRDPNYYGEPGGYPEAHLPGPLVGNVARGAVVAAECCYGAQLYNPDTATPLGISSTYMLQGAIAFCGSTNIAYGASTARERCSADVLCTEFMAAVNAKATTGRALLEARQRLVAASDGALDPFDLKTLGQFLLLGDPSLRPYGATSKRVDAVLVRKSKVTLALNAKDADGSKVVAHAKRRQRLKQSGAQLARSTPTARRARARVPDNVHEHLERLLRQEGLAPGATLQFAVSGTSRTSERSSAPYSRRAKIAKTGDVRARATLPSDGERIHVMFGSANDARNRGKSVATSVGHKKKQARVPRINLTRAVVARTRDGQIVSQHQVWAKSPPQLESKSNT